MGCVYEYAPSETKRYDACMSLSKAGSLQVILYYYTFDSTMGPCKIGERMDN